MGVIAGVPKSIFDDEGNVLYGTYRGAIEQADLSRIAKKKFFSPLFKEKRWHYALVYGSQWFFGAAIIDLGYATSGFFFLYDRQKQKMVAERSLVGPPKLAVVMNDHPLKDAYSSFDVIGLRIHFEHDPKSNEMLLHIRSSEKNQKIELSARLSISKGPTPITAIAPVDGRGKVNITVKAVGLPTLGKLTINDQTIVLSKDSLGLLDYSHGILDHHTEWHWAAGSGTGTKKEKISFNLVGLFNSSLENIVWIDNYFYKVGELELTPGSIVWGVRSKDFRVQLKFWPEGVHSENRKIGPVRVNYVQPFGRYEGTLTTPEGKTITLMNGCGICEEHEVVW